MTVRLLYITSDPTIGVLAEGAGVDWIFVDLEYRGKSERQSGRDTVISAHTIDDVTAMRRVVKRSQLMVRINPLGAWSQQEIDAVVDAGADIVMLPFFKTADEVAQFLQMLNGRAKSCLLLETVDAVRNVDAILNLPGIDFIHVGLNDLNIERGTRFMFEFLADGSMDELALKFNRKNITFGFGGMARIGTLTPPAERILAEHYRLGSSGVILARSFCPTRSTGRVVEDFAEFFLDGVKAIRNVEAMLEHESHAYFESNRLLVRQQVYEVANSIALT